MSLRFLLSLVIVSVWMSSCVSYQYLTVNSNLTHDDVKGFVLETDSVQISYQFNAPNGPVQIEIYNKTLRPLYLDWSKSAIVVNGETHPYWRNESSISAVADGRIVATDRRTTYSSQSISGKLSRPARTDFIPPNSSLRKAPVTLAPEFFTRPAVAQNKRTESKGALEVKIYEYDSSDSPLQFRSYLTISTDPDFVTVSTFDHAFWISHIHKAEHSLKKRFMNDNSTFQVIATNTAATVAMGVAGGLMIVGAAGQ